MAHGLYVLGNDVVFDFVVTCLRSIRHQEPDLPVRLLPYNNRLERLRPWLERLRIDVHEGGYDWCESVGNRLWERHHLHHAMFRKLAAFEGPFDEFLYLDADTALLAPTGRLFDLLRRGEADFISFDSDIDNVYKPGPLRDELLGSGRTRGFNAGAFLARRSALDRHTVENALAAAIPSRNQFHDIFDQSFLNFAIDWNNVRHRRARDLDASIPDKQWGDQVPFRWHDGAWRLMTPGHPDFGKAQPFIHWAGHDADDPKPNHGLFHHFRLLGDPWPVKAAFKAGEIGWWAVRPAARRARTLPGWARHKAGRLRTELSKLVR